MEEARNNEPNVTAAAWYVVHTYSGYENKVKTNIEKTIENRHLEDLIFEVRVPMEDVVEIKNGAKKQVQRKMFPGYVLIHMILNDDTWYVVRNTRGVTGFVGPGSKPVPLTETEMSSLGIDEESVAAANEEADETSAEEISTENIVLDFEVGDEVEVTLGNVTMEGVVRSINYSKQVVIFSSNLFAGGAPVEVSFANVRKL